jgi:hypothetical protein
MLQFTLWHTERSTSTKYDDPQREPTKVSIAIDDSYDSTIRKGSDPLIMLFYRAILLC